MVVSVVISVKLFICLLFLLKLTLTGSETLFVLSLINASVDVTPSTVNVTVGSKLGSVGLLQEEKNKVKVKAEVKRMRKRNSFSFILIFFTLLFFLRFPISI